MKKVNISLILLISILVMTTCSNPLDILEATTRAVMEANSRYIEVVSLSPAPDESDINGRELIQISFDREIDPNSFEGNITVTYSDNSGVNQYTANQWLFEYESHIKRVTINPDPWINASKAVTVRIENLQGTDGSKLKDPLVWSFRTSDEATFNITFGTPGNPVTYDNLETRTLRGNNSVPVLLQFSKSSHLYYYLNTDSSETSASFSGEDFENNWTPITDETDIDPDPSNYTIQTSYTFNSDGSSPLYLWVYDSEANGGSGKVLSIDSKTDYDNILIDRTPPTCSITLPSSTNDNTVTPTLTYDDNIEVAKHALRNDGTLAWTEYTASPGSLSWTLRNNSGTREVHYQVYDSVGNVSTLMSDTTNFLMPVKVQLAGFRFTVDNDFGYTEQWYWYFEVNNNEAFSRSGSSPLSFSLGTGRTLPAELTSAASVLFDKNSAIPYTYTSYVDVSSSLGTVAIEGIMFEEDGVTDDKTDPGWFTYLTTNARAMDTSWPKFADPTAYALGDDTLTGISILLKYWTTASYAAPGA